MPTQTLSRRRPSCLSRLRPLIPLPSALPQRTPSPCSAPGLTPPSFPTASPVPMTPLPKSGLPPSATTALPTLFPQFLLIPLLWPTTRDIPIDHPADAPLPEGSYDEGYST
eukprot:jgi/Psemu1/227225/e_gw1.1989.3.1